MIVFNELSIEPDGSKLTIDVSVREEEWFENVFLDKIIIDTQDTFTEQGPSEEAVATIEIEGSEKNLQLKLDKTDLMGTSLNDNLFFVYVKTKGVPSPDTPCGADQTYTIGVVLNTCIIYNNMMQGIKEVNKDCTIPKDFIDWFLRFKAFQLAINTEHYTEGIKYFNRFFKYMPASINVGCGCHG